MNFCFSSADILLPKSDMEKWAVIACDQYTSEPEYWENVRNTVGESTPSALNVILPEVYLKDDNSKQIESINSNMDSYLSNDCFEIYNDAMIFVDRVQSDGKHRLGIIGKIDLTQYDYNPGTNAAVRATEKTVVSRIPPRVLIRKNAALELPHVMLLIDDPDLTVIEQTEKKSKNFKTLYDFDLMLGAGHIKGSLIPKEVQEEIISSLKMLSDKNNGFLFSVGDGNHSLATAKECYNQNKTELSRYALVEIVNIHDSALQFEPIYRIVQTENTKRLIEGFTNGQYYNGADAQKFICVTKDGETEISVKPTSQLAVGTLQEYLDKCDNIEIDYIHGVDSLKKLAHKENTVGFLFDGMKKSELFPSVASDGSLPRKTFSMGHADDKRFYIEARKIR